MQLIASSLRNAIAAALVVGLVLPGGAVLAYEYQKTRKVALEDLQRDLTRSAEILALSLAEPIWQVSSELADPVVKAQMEDQRFVSVRVAEADSKIPFIEKSRPNPDPELSRTESRPVLREGREIATLTVTMSAEIMLKRHREEMMHTVGRNVLTLLLSLGLISLVLRRRVLSPMEALSGKADELAAGRLDQPIAVEGSDEIARVGLAMERMRQSLVRAFDDLRRHANTLESEVAERTNELTRANGELTDALATLKAAQRELVESEKLASLGRLVAGVAHELNTPLGNAMTVVSALQDRWSGLEDMLNRGEPMRRSQLLELVQDTRRGQDILQRNVQKAADLVRDFKQVSIDQTSDSRRDFELDHVVKDVVVMVEPSFKPTPFKIQMDLSPGLRMNSYPGSLGQVLTNLLMNSLVHGFEGLSSGTVHVRCTERSDGQLELRVSDNGRGMDAEVVRKIYDPFFTTKLGKGGSGLGMHIVHNIVTNVLGGQIEVSSTPGEGTTTTVTLPTVAPDRTLT